MVLQLRSGAIGLVFPSTSLGGHWTHTLEGTSLGLEANSHLSSSLGCFEPKRKGLPSSPAQEVNGSPSSDVTSDSGIYSVPGSAATRDSPSCMGTAAQSNNYAQVTQVLFVQPCHPWKTQLGFGPVNVPQRTTRVLSPVARILWNYASRQDQGVELKCVALCHSRYLRCAVLPPIPLSKRARPPLGL